VLGDVLDGHAARQFQGVALEGAGIGPPRGGEGDLDLPDDTAVQAFDARDGQSTKVARLPMGKDRKRRRTRPRNTTWDEPQAEQRQSSGSWWMVKITWPFR
jgi:hypothetical protein